MGAAKRRTHDAPCFPTSGPGKDDAVQPGKSADVMLSCLDNFRVVEDQLQFVMYEGGRRVGSGQLTPP